MIQVSNVSLRFGGRKLFEDVNLKFTKGNCYGIIGANGAGKSTFLKILTGEVSPNKGEVIISPNERMSVLNQNQEAFNDCTALQTVIKGHRRLVEIMEQKDALYAKADFSEQDGMVAAELEGEFAELGGWEAESDAEALLNKFGVDSTLHNKLMGDIEPKVKVKVLLAQALFGNPDILVLDEPTNNLDVVTTKTLEDFLLDFDNILIIVSHNRHFLNKVCTHICDVDYGQINMFTGNYDFWYETSQLMARQAKEQNKKMEQRAKELQEFIARFSANASKSRQATSRKKELEKITLNDIKPSNRKYPYIDFKVEREAGNDILIVENLTKPGYFHDVSFRVNKGDKIGFVSSKENKISALFKILAGEDQDYTGTVKFGKTITLSYMPQNYNKYFDGNENTLVDWLADYSEEKDQTYLRSWLGRMLFAGEEGVKKAKVLSGGEKARCMLAKMMLTSGNFLIFDEPTNHLDLESITALNKGMINYKGNILFTSHDQELMQTVANVIIRLEDTITFNKSITYDEYLEKYY